MRLEGNTPWSGFSKEKGEIRPMDFPFSFFDRERLLPRVTSWVSLGVLVLASFPRLLYRPDR